MPRRLAVPVLLLATGCGFLNPALAYRKAAERLHFSLDRVDPRLDLGFPLERSALRLKVQLAVDNPSDLRLRTGPVEARLDLHLEGRPYTIGTLRFPGGADLAPGGRSLLSVEVRLGYQDLKLAWEPLSQVLLRGRRATWSLSGEVPVEMLGLERRLPFRVERETGP